MESLQWNVRVTDSMERRCRSFCSHAGLGGLAVRDGMSRAYAGSALACHNLGHVKECCRMLDELRSLAEDGMSTKLEIFSHDAVYDPKRRDNEEMRARLALDFLQAYRRVAADEFKVKCDDLVRRYRLKPNADSEILEDLNDFVEKSDDAISLPVNLVGGSWGGSGARGGYAQARMKAHLNFHRNLEALGASLHLQDLPE